MRTALRAACAGYALIFVFQLIGCRSPRLAQSANPPASEPSVAKVAASPPVASVQQLEERQIESVAYSEVVSEELEMPLPTVVQQSLEIEPLVAEVLAKNPDIRSAAAAWQAAAQRYPQVVSLDDPMFGAMLGPGSWGSDEVNSAYTLEASQRIPWPGKRRLRGEIARAEASAAYFDVGEQRLLIAEATRLAYYDYILVHQLLDLLDESSKLLGDFREIALKKYESAEAQQQDVLLADVELAQLERQRLERVRMERVARARINTLLLAPPDSPLPLPPESFENRASLPPADELVDLALSQRPELAAQAARIRRERYAAALAQKEFYPDMEFVARYDAFWQEEPLRPMVGMNINVPIYKEKRRASVREADARSAQQQATLDSQAYEISFQVEQAYQRVQESEEAVKVYEERILPAARHSVESAQASYTAGRLDFLRLIEAQRQLLQLEEDYYAAVAEYHQRLSELNRQIGVLPIQ